MSFCILIHRLRVLLALYLKLLMFLLVLLWFNDRYLLCFSIMFDRVCICLWLLCWLPSEPERDDFCVLQPRMDCFIWYDEDPISWTSSKVSSFAYWRFFSWTSLAYLVGKDPSKYSEPARCSRKYLVFLTSCILLNASSLWHLLL